MNNNNIRTNRLNNANNNNSSITSTIVLIIIIILVVVLLYFVGRIIYKKIQDPKKQKVSSNTLLDAVNDGTNEFTISSSELSASNYSNEYSLSFWVYVDDFSYRQGKRKFILKRGTVDNVINPVMYLDPFQNDLHVNFTLMNRHLESQESTTTAPEATTTTAPEATTTTAPETTTTTTQGATKDSFTAVEGFGDCGNVDFEQENVLYKRNLKGISTNEVNANEIRQEYNNDYFNLVQGNRVCGIKNRGCNCGDETHIQEMNVDIAGKNQVSNPIIEGFENGQCGDSVVEPTDEEFDKFLESAGSCIVKRFPIQKWVHVVLTQYNDVIDLYVDGKLRSSCVLPGYPAISSDDLILSPYGGFSGEMTNMIHYNNGINSEKVYQLYKRGPYNKRTIFENIPAYVYYMITFIILLLIIFILI